MTTASILALSVGLAMDATTVSVARGFAAQSLRVRDVIKVAGFFGGFQAGMAAIGWFLGEALGSLVAAWAHWIGFVVLGVLGSKMVWDAKSPRSPDERRGLDVQRVFGTMPILLLALATSVDALAVGVTLPVLGAPRVLSVVSIGVITALLSALGVAAGQRLGARLGGRLDALGGVVLLVLASKLLASHYDWP